MTAHRTLILNPDQDAAEGLALNPEKVVLPGRVVHVDVHGADGDAVADIGNRIASVVSGTNGGWIRVEDRIRATGIEVNQRVKGWVPGTIGPDVVEDAVIKDTVTSANGHFAVAFGIPGEANARSKVFVVGVPHPGYRVDPCRRDATRVQDIAVQVGELCKDVMHFTWRSVTVPTNAEVQRQPRGQLPIILNEPIPIVIGIVTVGVGLCARCWVDRGLLIVRIVPGKIGIGLTGYACDRPVGLKRPVACSGDDRAGWTSCAGAARVNRREFAEFVSSGQAQIPVAVQNAILVAASELQGVPSGSPGEVVGDPPAVLSEPNDLAAFRVPAQIGSETSTSLVINGDKRKSVYCSFPFCADVVVTIVRYGHFIEEPGAKGVCFS